MNKRFVSLYFPYLKTDWLAIRKPELRDKPVVLSAKDHNRVVITAASPAAEKEGLFAGMVVADARALLPELIVMDDKPGREGRLLRGLGEWAIRWTPVTAVDGPNGVVDGVADGLLLDVSGCTHLWGGEAPYLKEILRRLRTAGYNVRGAMADTMLAARAVARYGKGYPIVAPGEQTAALAPLPCCALGLDAATTERLQQLGLATIDKFISMPRGALRRRFGQELLLRLDQALGNAPLSLEPICPGGTFCGTPALSGAYCDSDRHRDRPATIVERTLFAPAAGREGITDGGVQGLSHRREVGVDRDQHDTRDAPGYPFVYVI